MKARGGWLDRLLRRPASETDRADGNAPVATTGEAQDDDALGRATALLERSPGDADQAFARGALLAQAGRTLEAVASLRRAEAAGARSPEFRLRFAWALHGAGAVAQARALADALAESEPQSFDAQCAAALIARSAGDAAGAAVRLRRALVLRPGDPRVTAWLANAESASGRPAVGLELARALVEAHPGHAEAWEALAYAQNLLDRPRETIEALDRVIALAGGADAGNFAPLARQARIQRAVELFELSRFDDAIAGLVEVLRAGPSIEAQLHLSLHLIARGQFGDGWRKYAIRWLHEPYAGRRPHPELPRWHGQPLDGRSVLIGAEQGIGDVIMFARFAPRLAALGGKAMLVVEPALARLASGFRGVDRVLAGGDPLPPVDYFTSLGGLMTALSVELDTVPRDVPYLTARADQREHWARRIGTGDDLRVGIVWAGSPAHVRDAERSMTFAELEPLFDVEGVRFHSLQKGPQVSQLQASPYARRVIDLAPGLADYTETIAAIDNLDLVISVDTSVAHAAGALAKPVWLMVCRPAEYRWLHDREDAVWYPTMRVFRQARYKDWSTVIDDVRRALVAAVDARRRGHPWSEVPSAPWAPPPTAVDLAGVPDVVEARDGVFQLPSGGVDPEARSLAAFGEYLSGFSNAVLQLVPTGGALVLVHAGIGSHATALARRLGTGGHLLAFESSPGRLPFLAQNLAGNRIANATVLGSRLGDPASGASIDRLHVDRLDGVVIHGGDDADPLFAGAERTLWKFRPWVALESASADVLRRAAWNLGRYGYRSWAFEVPMFVPMNYNRSAVDVFDGAVRHGLLALPEEREARMPAPAFAEISGE